MNRENRLAAESQMHRLSLRNNRLQFKTSENLPIILEESTEYASHPSKINREITTCNQLDMETLGIWPMMPRKSPWTLARCRDGGVSFSEPPVSLATWPWLCDIATQSIQKHVNEGVSCLQVDKDIPILSHHINLVPRASTYDEWGLGPVLLSKMLMIWRRWVLRSVIYNIVSGTILVTYNLSWIHPCLSGGWLGANLLRIDTRKICV